MITFVYVPIWTKVEGGLCIWSSNRQFVCPLAMGYDTFMHAAPNHVSCEIWDRLEGFCLLCLPCVAVCVYLYTRNWSVGRH